MSLTDAAARDAPKIMEMQDPFQPEIPIVGPVKILAPVEEQQHGDRRASFPCSVALRRTLDRVSVWTHNRNDACRSSDGGDGCW